MIISRLTDGSAATEAAGEVEFDSSCDLLVVGLGTAGAICLTAAARRGLKVLGLEKLNCMGGSATAGGVNHYYMGLQGGLFEEVDAAVKELESQSFLPTSDNSFNQSAKAYCLERMAVEAGAGVEYGAAPTGIVMDGSTVAGVEWISQEGIRRTACRFLVDATGDGEVAAMAGCKFLFGRPSDGTPQPYSYTRLLSGGNGAYYANFDAGYVDITSGASVSEALLHGGRLHLRDNFDDAGAKLISPALLLGPREGRLIVGDEMIRFADFVNGIESDRPVFYAFANFDTHTRDWVFENEEFQEWLIVASLWSQGVSIPVPAGTLIARDVDGLLLAGRCLSVDHGIAQALRMERCMQKAGEAVGVMAALALEGGVSVREVDYDSLRCELLKTGCLNEDPPPTMQGLFMEDPDTLKRALASDAPGLAIWSCRRLGPDITGRLEEWMESEEQHLPEHAALAMGLTGDSRALPVLRKMVEERDEYTPETGRSRNSRHLCSGIFLLGRLGVGEDVEILGSLLSDPGPDDFEVFSLTVNALLLIGRRMSDLRERVASLIAPALKSGDLKVEMPLQGGVCAEQIEGYLRLTAAAELKSWNLDAGVPIPEPESMSFRERMLWSAKVEKNIARE